MSARLRVSRWLPLLLCGCALLSGCGPEDETPSEKPITAAQGAKAVAAKADPAKAAAESPAKGKQARSPSDEIPPPATAAATTAPPPPHSTTAAPASDWTAMLFVFLLSALIGLGVITRVSRLLHTPLMSLTNAISAIAVIGAITVAGSPHPLFITFLGAVALFASTTNIVSGFLITDRMLKMFKKQETRS